MSVKNTLKFLDGFYVLTDFIRTIYSSRQFHNQGKAGKRFGNTTSQKNRTRISKISELLTPRFEAIY